MVRPSGFVEPRFVIETIPDYAPVSKIMLVFVVTKALFEPSQQALAIAFEQMREPARQLASIAHRLGVSSARTI
jgi:hypothetical protein